eukprot:2258874-Amphidinium_carterae.1
MVLKYLDSSCRKTTSQQLHRNPKMVSSVSPGGPGSAARLDLGSVELLRVNGRWDEVFHTQDAEVQNPSIQAQRLH